MAKVEVEVEGVMSESPEKEEKDGETTESDDDDDDNDDDDDDDDKEEPDDEPMMKEEDDDETPKKKKNKKASSSSSSGNTANNNKNTKKKKGTTTSTSGGKASSSSSASTPYTQLIQDAILAMKDRTGSSQPAIQKWILMNHPDIDPQKLKQRFLLTLKNGVKAKRFVKVKSSYKVSTDFLNRCKKKKAAAAAAKKKKAAALAVANAKAKQAMTVRQPTKAEIAARLEKERREAKEKERQDRIRKRKFPMDDLRLIEEDKELAVSVTLPTRPTLELAIPDMPNMCKSDTTGNGILDDIFHIYHFFVGDVGWGRWSKQQSAVAPFTLDHLIQCIQQIMKGWAKKARMVPPLLSHLFVVALQQLVPDKLAVALTPASWSEVLLLYMDAMERYYTSEASEGSNVLQSVGIDGEYLFYVTDELMDTDSLVVPTRSEPFYLQGSLEKAHGKLLTQDPWTLSAEELLVLLKALVDDVLATATDCSDELDKRLEDTYELLKRKRTADANYRKLLAAHNKELAEETKERVAPSEGGEDDKASNDSNNNTAPSKGSSSAATTKRAKMREAQLEKARKEQQKANDSYEKACGGKLIRTGPIGLDRNFNQVYHAWNDPERVYVLQRGKPIPPNINNNTLSSIQLDGLQQDDVYRLTWHSIDKRSILEKYVESLDVRGTREQGLHEALQPVKRLVYDDIKEMNAKKALLKEKNDVRRRLENARLKFETGRKSGRLVAQSEQELFDLQDEIERLEKSVEEGDVVEEYDFEVATGLQMLRNFDDQEAHIQKRRASRRDTQKRQKVEEEQDSHPKLPCSHLWPSGHIDGTGIVGLIATQLLELEERVERLVKWETGDRKAWIANLETATHAWNEGTLPFLLGTGGESTTTGGGGGLTMSPDQKVTHNNSNGSSNHRMSMTPGSTSSSSQQSTTTLTPYQILSMIKQPLLDLESRVFEASGLAMAAKDADEADDNMSTSPEDEEEQIKFAWKKLIHRLKSLPAKANAKIRQCVIEAIAAARKAHNNVVVAQLREALLQYHPEAAGLCKTTALEVLAEHGDYDDQDDDDEEEDDEDDKDDVEEDRENATKNQTAESGISSVLCAEAVTLVSSLDGQEDASREDWISAVKKTKTLSKMAALVSAFCNNAAAKLEKMESEQLALADVMAAWGSSDSARRKKGYQYATSEPSEVWANVDFSDEFCLVKVDTYPWWPARKCTPKVPTLASQLDSLGRVIVSLIGESGGLRVVKEDALLPFSETLPPDEDLGTQPREIRNQLDDCMAMARRIVRGKLKKKTAKGKKVALNGAKANGSKEKAVSAISKDKK